MATYPQSTSAASRRADQLRAWWSTVRGPSATFMSQTRNYFLARPPLAQGIYYALTGFWALTFGSPFVEAGSVYWLVRMSGLLVLIIGAMLCVAAYRRHETPEVYVVGLGSALGLAMLDLTFVARGDISRWYLFDAMFQVLFIVLWVYAWTHHRERNPVPAPTAAVPQSFPVATPVARAETHIKPPQDDASPVI